MEENAKSEAAQPPRRTEELQPLDKKELEPKRWVGKDEIPPRRTGLSVIFTISGLLAALFLAMYISLGVCKLHTDSLIQEYMHVTMAAASTENQRGLSKENLDRIVQESDTTRKEFFDFTEKVGLALISLLSAVVGYTLKGEASQPSE